MFGCHVLLDGDDVAVIEDIFLRDDEHEVGPRGESEESILAIGVCTRLDARVTDAVELFLDGGNDAGDIGRTRICRQALETADHQLDESEREEEHAGLRYRPRSTGYDSS